MRSTLRSLLLAVAACMVLVVGGAVAATFSDVGGNTFTTGITLGSAGTLMEDSYSATLSTAFGGVAASTCKDSAAITVTGASTGDPCVVGIHSDYTGLLSYSCYVSATSAVKIRICNPAASSVDTHAGTTTARSHYVRVFDP